MLWDGHTNFEPPSVPLPTMRECRPCTMDTWSCERVYLNWRSGVLNKTSCHMWDNWNFPMSCWGIDLWPWWTWPSWWSLWCCEIPYPQWRSCPPWYDDLWCWHGHKWGKNPEMLLQPFPKGPCRLPCVLITLQPVTPIPVYYSTFLSYVIFVLWDHQGVLTVLLPLKWTWTPILPQMC